MSEQCKRYTATVLRAVVYAGCPPYLVFYGYLLLFAFSAKQISIVLVGIILVLTQPAAFLVPAWLYARRHGDNFLVLMMGVPGFLVLSVCVLLGYGSPSDGNFVAENLCSNAVVFAVVSAKIFWVDPRANRGKSAADAATATQQRTNTAMLLLAAIALLIRTVMPEYPDIVLDW